MKDDLTDSALIPFFALTFAISAVSLGGYLVAPEATAARLGALHPAHPLFITAVYAPAISAAVLILGACGPTGLWRFLGRLGLWRAPQGWWVFLLLGIPALSFAGAAIKGTAAAAPLFTEAPGALLAAMGFMLILGPVEEFGWRGVALPLLQRRMAPIWAGLILGAIWGLWHLPAFFLSGLPQSAWPFVPFLLGSVAVSVILTAFFNAASGSLLIAVLFHFQLNNPLWPDAQPWDMYLFALAACLVVVLCRRDMITRGAAVTRVVPLPSPRTKENGAREGAP